MRVRIEFESAAWQTYSRLRLCSHDSDPLRGELWREGPTRHVERKRDGSLVDRGEDRYQVEVVPVNGYVGSLPSGKFWTSYGCRGC